VHAHQQPDPHHVDRIDPGKIDDEIGIGRTRPVAWLVETITTIENIEDVEQAGPQIGRSGDVERPDHVRIGWTTRIGWMTIGAGYGHLASRV
jgi:hypothetical protein